MPMVKAGIILAALTAALAMPALAQDTAPPALPSPPPALQSPPAGAASSATCMNAGNVYKVGDYACIAACHGQRRLARCDAVNQAASWTYVSNACPSAMINPAWPSDWTEVPAATDMTPVPVTVRMSAIDPKIAPLIGSHFTGSVLTR